MSILHPDRWLAAHCEGELPAERSARVASHLDRCARCRARVADVQRGLAFARTLQPSPPPAEVDAGIELALRSPQRAARRAPRGVHGWRWAAAAGVAAVLIGLLWLVSRAGVEVETAPVAMGSLERVGLAAHRRLAAGELPMDLRSESPAAIRKWLSARGLSAALVTSRPPEDGDRFRAVGAAAVDHPGLPAAAVAYTVDGQHVILVTARQVDVPDAPRWSAFGKRVRYREIGDARVLTWSNSGKAYALVSELPRLGRDACLLCHADARRREVVRRLTPPPPPHT